MGRIRGNATLMEECGGHIHSDIKTFREIQADLKACSDSINNNPYIKDVGASNLANIVYDCYVVMEFWLRKTDGYLGALYDAASAYTIAEVKAIAAFEGRDPVDVLNDLSGPDPWRVTDGYLRESHVDFKVFGEQFGMDFEIGGLIVEIADGDKTWDDVFNYLVDGHLSFTGGISGEFGGSLFTTNILIRKGTRDDNVHIILGTASGNAKAAAGVTAPGAEGVKGYDGSYSATQLNIGFGSTTNGDRESYLVNLAIGGKGSTANITTHENGTTVNYAPSYLDFKKMGLGFTYENDISRWKRNQEVKEQQEPHGVSGYAR